MEIPWKALDEKVLERLLEEVVTRDGTDYGANEKTRQQKIAEARKALQTGKAVLQWDADLESASIEIKI